MVNAASSLWVKDGKFTDVRISLGAVSPVVIRAPQAEASLEGETVSDDLINGAGRIAVTECKPINDFRASLEYRNDLIEVLTRRTLQAAVEIATQE